MSKATLDHILERLRATEQEMDRVLAERREQFHYTLRRSKVIFERGVRRWQRQQRTGVWRYLLDRHNLAYLNAIERFNCVYCDHGNGLIEYAREVTARIEQYGCPIKHARRTRDPHGRSRRFFDYGDVQAYRAGLRHLRKDWDGDSAP